MDEDNKEALEKLGWKVLIVWEYGLKKSLKEERLNLLCRQVTE
jgi:DNA mismatch endonuclease (patch repair protein)